MGRLDPAAALRAGRAALETMVPGAEVGSPKVSVTVKPPVGTAPEPPSADEHVLAAAPGTSPQQRAAREKVMRDFYQNRMGLGAPLCAQHLQAVNLDHPVEVATLPPAIRLRLCADVSESENVFVRVAAPLPSDFEVAEAFDALSCTSRGVGGHVLVVDDANRDGRMRKI